MGPYRPVLCLHVCGVYCLPVLPALCCLFRLSSPPLSSPPPPPPPPTCPSSPPPPQLALPNMYAWLCMFYCLFHLWLNILAELLRFGDREFYKDWWNASTVGEYWRLWNMPVHKVCVCGGEYWRLWNMPVHKV